MKNVNKVIVLLTITIMGFIACSSNDEDSLTEIEETIDTDDADDNSTSEYDGTASVTQGLATTTTTNLFSQGVRVSGLGSIEATDGTTWTVPAEVKYTEDAFPFASDLYNVYGNTYASAASAINDLDGNDIVEIDAEGEVITGYIFADNYFEMYVNGVAVGKDAVPFTEFNSSIVRFKVTAPYTIAMKLVDWEENLGLGSESNGGSAFHAGDGGMVAVFKNESDEVVAITGSDWKAQTFYTAPIKDLACPTESGTIKNAEACDSQDVSDGSSFYGLHWAIDSEWETEGFDDSEWPSATTYTNNEIGVDNKASYTNFTEIFDDNTSDADFIWSTNVVLDNLVLVRYRVQ